VTRPTAEADPAGQHAAERSWPPPGPAARGTVIVLPGRGEHGGVYERLGRRLAADGYAVHALDLPPDGGIADVERAVAPIAERAAAPVVLAGSDTGALYALAAAACGAVRVDALLLAGLPHPTSRPEDLVPRGGGVEPAEDAADDAWAWELAARTSCPVHRARLAGDARFTRGGLADPVGPVLAALARDLPVEDVALPTLILHGGDDPVAPPRGARDLAARLPRAELAVVDGGRHDVLNDASHRSVAAHAVLWLERLRTGDVLAPIVVVEPVARLAAAG
jgi:alpha-beta hydrolase superfamily lysophospholipase